MPGGDFSTEFSDDFALGTEYVDIILVKLSAYEASVVLTAGGRSGGGFSTEFSDDFDLGTPQITSVLVKLSAFAGATVLSPA